MPNILPFPRITSNISRHTSLCRAFSSCSKLRYTETVTNQIFSTEADNHLQQIYGQFTSSQIKYTFGYGSGVFPQAGYDSVGSKRPQIDMIHIVENSETFHKENSAEHSNHYSALLKCGIGAVSAVQMLGAGVYFNPYVPMSDSQGSTSMIKYGVISAEDAFKDITEWTTMYVAGRLHKPVKHFGANEKLLQANHHNLSSAFNLSLLLLPNKKRQSSFTETALYEKIAQLSYMGDPRMLVGGENPNKVKNIVSKQADKFSVLYEPFLTEALEKGILVYTKDSMLEKRMNPQAVAEIIAGFPLQFKRRLLRSYRGKYQKLLDEDAGMKRFLDGESTEVAVGSFVESVARDSFLRAALKTTILATIAYPAFVQTFKGIFTAGILKSAKYAWEKKMKSRPAS